MSLQKASRERGVIRVTNTRLKLSRRPYSLVSTLEFHCKNPNQQTKRLGLERGFLPSRNFCCRAVPSLTRQQRMKLITYDCLSRRLDKHSKEVLSTRRVVTNSDVSAANFSNTWWDPIWAKAGDIIMPTISLLDGVGLMIRN